MDGPKQKKKGYLYAISHDCWDAFYGSGTFKLGCTSDLEKRVAVYNTSFPDPVKLFKVVKVDDMALGENIMKFALSDERLRQDREFFKAPPDKIAETLERVRDHVMRSKPLSTVEARCENGDSDGSGVLCKFCHKLVPKEGARRSVGRHGQYVCPECIAQKHKELEAQVGTVDVAPIMRAIAGNIDREGWEAPHKLASLWRHYLLHVAAGPAATTLSKKEFRALMTLHSPKRATGEEMVYLPPPYPFPDQ